MAEAHERGKDRGDFGLDSFSLFELHGDALRIDNAGRGSKRREDRCALLESTRGKTRFLFRLEHMQHGGYLRAFLRVGLLVARATEARDLVIGPQPAHMPALLLLGALLVERHEARQDVLVGQSVGPAIGLEDETVEPLMQFLQDKDEALVLDALLVIGECDGGAVSRCGLYRRGSPGQARGRRTSRDDGECAAGSIASELFQNVVHLRQGEFRMFSLALLAESIELFGDGADFGLEGGGRIREGEGIEAAGLRVARSIFECSAKHKRPGQMYLRRENSEVESIFAADTHEHIVGPYVAIEKCKPAMLRGLGGDHIPREILDKRAVHFVSGAKPPPLPPSKRHVVLVSARFDVDQYVLIDLRIAFSNFVACERIKVDHHCAP